MISQRIVLTGVPDVVRALDSIDPKANQRLNAALNQAASELVQTAKGFVDPQGLSGWGNWRGGYDPSVIAGGIKVRKSLRSKSRGKTVNLVGVKNSTAAGAIWEVAGRKTAGKGPGEGKGGRGYGAAMIAGMNARGGAASRTIWAAADTTDMAGVQGKIVDALNTALAEVQQGLK